MLSMEKYQELRTFAHRIRGETLRELGSLGFGHIGGCMSIVEVLAVLYGAVMQVDAADPEWSDRDRLVLSKGHAGPALYAALALRGFFPLEMLQTLNQGGTRLPSHADRCLTPGVDMTTGSLGQGLSAAVGMAWGLRLDGSPSFVYTILGDGECQEGQIWEAVLFAGNAGLGNLIVFIDHNQQQLDGWVQDINPLGELRQKWENFGWHAQDVDGHDTAAIYEAVLSAQAAKGSSSVIVLHTVKGKGCSFAEGETMNHHMRFTQEQMEQALADWEKEGETLL